MTKDFYLNILDHFFLAVFVRVKHDGQSETGTTRSLYLNNELYLSRNYRLRVASRKIEVLEQTFAREAKERGFPTRSNWLSMIWLNKINKISIY